MCHYISKSVAIKKYFLKNELTEDDGRSFYELIFKGDWYYKVYKI